MRMNNEPRPRMQQSNLSWSEESHNQIYPIFLLGRRSPPKAPPIHTALTHPQYISALEPRPRAFAPPEPAPVNVPRQGDRSLRLEVGHALGQPLIGRSVSREAMGLVCSSLAIDAERISLGTGLGLYLTCRCRTRRLVGNEVEFYSHSTQCLQWGGLALSLVYWTHVSRKGRQSYRLHRHLGPHPRGRLRHDAAAPEQTSHTTTFAS
jgi:hypothetical protein